MARTARLLGPLLTIILGAVACTDGDDASPTSTPDQTDSTRTSEPTAPAKTPSSPTQVATTPRTLELRPAIAPPANSQLFIVTGCTQCDGPDETLQLHQTSAAGITAATTIMGPGHEALQGMTVGQIDGASDGTVLAVAACAEEYCGGLGNREQPTEWRVLVSVNDGADWAVAWEGAANYVFLEDVTVEGIIVGEIHPDGTIPSSRKLTLINLAGQRRELTQPDGAGEAFILRGGRVGWIEYPGPQGGIRSKLFNEDGSEMPLVLPPSADIGAVDSLQDGALALSLFGTGRSLAFYSSAGGPATTIVDLADLTLPHVHYEGQFALANNFASGGGPSETGPVLIDLRALTATPLTTEHLSGQQGRNRFIAYDIE